MFLIVFRSCKLKSRTDTYVSILFLLNEFSNKVFLIELWWSFIIQFCMVDIHIAETLLKHMQLRVMVIDVCECRFARSNCQSKTFLVGMALTLEWKM